MKRQEVVRLLLPHIILASHFISHHSFDYQVQVGLGL